MGVSLAAAPPTPRESIASRERNAAVASAIAYVNACVQPLAVLRSAKEELAYGRARVFGW